MKLERPRQSNDFDACKALTENKVTQINGTVSVRMTFGQGRRKVAGLAMVAGNLGGYHWV